MCITIETHTFTYFSQYIASLVTQNLFVMQTDTSITTKQAYVEHNDTKQKLIFQKC